jgi:hypothetical protein
MICKHYAAQIKGALTMVLRKCLGAALQMYPDQPIHNRRACIQEAWFRPFGSDMRLIAEDMQTLLRPIRRLNSGVSQGLWRGNANVFKAAKP